MLMNNIANRIQLTVVSVSYKSFICPTKRDPHVDRAYQECFVYYINYK